MEKKIKILLNGPYEVSGLVPLNVTEIISDSNGVAKKLEKKQDYTVEETYLLCRCGKSTNKPFCTGHHKKEFNGTETAGRLKYDDLAKKTLGADLNLKSVKSLCSGARFCIHTGGIKNLVKNSHEEKSKELIKEKVSHCISGCLTLEDKEGKSLEPRLEQEISAIIDSYKKTDGPLWVKGNIKIEDSNGLSYEKRNRIALCRCGKSRNKPFCDGAHSESC